MIEDFISKLDSLGITISIVDQTLDIKAPKGVINKEILSDIKINKEEIIQFIKHYKKNEFNFESINKVKESIAYQVSSSQQRLWVLSQFKEGSFAYNMPGVFEFEGALNKEVFKASFDLVLERHESLRTVFTETEEEVRQVIKEVSALGFEVLLLDCQSQSEGELSNSISEEIAQNFDLSNGPLLRATLYQTSKEKYVFTFVMHHIISDGWSMGVLIRDLLTIYNSKVNNEPIPLEPLRIHYKDYTAWQQEQLQGEELEKHKEYWLDQFEGELSALDLPSDYTRPAVKTYNGDILKGTVNNSLTNQLKILTKEKGGTLFMGLLGLVNTLFYRYTGQEDIILGSPVAGRNHVELENQIGFYINTLALRTRFEGSNSFNELLENIKEVTLGAYGHQVYPFDELVDELNLSRDMSRNPLFDVMVSLQNNDASTGGQTLGDVRVTPYEGGEHVVSKFDMTYNFKELETGELAYSIEYNTDIYSERLVTQMSIHLVQLLKVIVENPSQSINDLAYLSEVEKYQVLVEFNDTAVDYPRDKTIIQFFEKQVEKTPDNIAIVFKEVKLTYKELNEKANQLGHYLKLTYSIEPDDLIGIKLDRSEQMIIAILGVLKSGGAYVPIDPEYPDERIKYIEEDSNCKVIIDENELSLSSSAQPITNPDISTKSTDLAYVIYTSGSTGKPKGVMIEHKSLVSFFENSSYHFGFKESKILASSTNFTFDISILEHLGVLVSGMKLLLLDNSSESLLTTLKNKKVDILQVTPSKLNQLLLLEENSIKYLSELNYLLIGGEPLGQKLFSLLKSDLKQVNVLNVYGPTETVIWSAFSNLHQTEKLTIGSPLLNESIIICGPNNKLVPVNVNGEICISGAGLSRGYLNQPELTAEKFIAHPFKDGERLYKTGDIGRYLPDGDIEFIGRKDDQVKIRGYRIELGEIESCLQQLEGVNTCVVLAKEFENSQELVAYTKGNNLSISDIRKELGKVLPSYMIPTHFVELEEFPLTPSGKVDKKALPNPEGLEMGTGVEYIGPRNTIEEQLVLIWSEVLGIEVDKIGINDNFFDLGGHSLRVIKLLSRTKKSFNVEIDLKDLYSHTTVLEITKLIEGANKNSFLSIPLQKESDSYALSSAQRRLWTLSQIEEGSAAYNMSFKTDLRKDFNFKVFSKAIDLVIERHEALRTVFKEDLNEEVRQWILDSYTLGFSISYEDYSDTLEASSLIDSSISEDIPRSFDLEKGPLLRATLYKRGEDDYIFYFNMHHIIGDGWSLNVIFNDVLSIYDSLLAKEEINLPVLRIQYKDYSAWQISQMDSPEASIDKSYWLDQLSGELPLLDLPGGHLRPSVKTYNGHTIGMYLPKSLSVGLRDYISSKGGTLFMGILSSLQGLLHRYTGMEDIVIGTPVAGRNHLDLEDQIGFYINSLVLRNDVFGGDSFDVVYERVKETVMTSYSHQMYPFDSLVEELGYSRQTSRSAIFDVMLVLQNTNDRHKAREILSSEEGVIYDGVTGASIYDIKFEFREEHDHLNFIIQYNTDIYDREMLEGFMNHYASFLEGLLSDSKKPISDIKYLPEADLLSQLNLLDYSNVNYDKTASIVSLFEEQVSKNPDSTAIVHERNEITYLDLNNKANQLAGFLSSLSLAKESKIGLFLSPGMTFIVSLLGVLKSGHCYVPLDLSLPEERLHFLMSDTSMPVLIGGKDNLERAYRFQWSLSNLEHYLCIDSDDVLHEVDSEENIMMSQELWDHVGERAEDQITGGGWLSSYTGNAIPEEEMEEYSVNAYKKLKEILHKDMRVIEIGCSSGITMSKIAPDVAFYCGTDLSPVILSDTAKLLKEKGLDNVKLKQCVAHDISSIDEGDFDLIIINSVIQNFHGHNYLRGVIEDSISLLGEKGEIFIGDVMDMDAKGAFLEDLGAFAKMNVGKGYTTKMDFSADLFVSRGFFEDLRVDIPVVYGVEVSEKIKTIENELTEFRYDVLLKVDKKATSKEFPRNKHQYGASNLVHYSEENLGLEIKPSSLAYIIYTSGTTGKPKGVLIEHGNVVRLMKPEEPLFDFGVDDIWCLFHSPAFDVSVWEIYGALLFGGKLVIVPKLIAQDTDLFLELLEQEQVTVLNQTPSSFYRISDNLEKYNNTSDLSLRYLIFAGEALRPPKLSYWHEVYPQTKLINMYGPTETTILTTFKELKIEDFQSESSNIGVPIPTASAYVVDSGGDLVPQGVIGELYVGGKGVSRGYLNRDELTTERFVSGELLGLSLDEKLYRSGDKVRILPGGELEYLGRIDDQVKIRGYRIELGEIENALRLLVGIEDSVVLECKRDEECSLCAFIVYKNEGLEVNDLRKLLGKTLPAYMLPSNFIEVDEFPITGSGKLDKRKLKQLLSLEGRKSRGENHISPRTETEQVLLKIWQEILGEDLIDVHDDFFDLGGHSLKATRLSSLLHKKVGIKLELKDLFEVTTIEGQAKLLLNKRVADYSNIEALEELANYPVSSSQRRLWVLSQFEEGSFAYNISGVYVFEGDLNSEAFISSFDLLLERHESLRTVFETSEEGDIHQKIKTVNELDFKVSEFDYQNQSERTLQKTIKEELIEVFDLTNGPLLRATLYQTNSNNYVFTFVMHHIISDGWSFGVLIRDLLTIYNAKVNNNTVPLEPLRIQYKDYAAWQQEQFHGQEFENHKKYWLGQFDGDLPVLDLPSDYTRPSVKTYNGSLVHGIINKNLTTELNKLIKEKGGTLFMGLLSLVNTLFHKYTGQEDIILGSPIAGREHVELENQIGFYVNTLALRTRFEGSNSFNKLLEKVKEVTLDAFEHQIYPFDELVDGLNLNRDMSRNPLFDVMVSLQNNDSSTHGQTLGNVKVTPYEEGDHMVSKFDMTYNFTELENGELTYNIEYNTDIYSERLMNQLGNHLVSLLEEIVENPNQSINELDYLSKVEKDQLLVEFNNTNSNYQEDKTIIQLFGEQVEKTPDNIAVVFENVELTYRELNEKSNQLGHYLQSTYSIKPDDLIGIKLDRSEQLIIAILGVLKSGGAYVPIDPEYPEDRINYIKEDSNCKVVIDEKELSLLSNSHSITKPETSTKSTDLAYVIYTSGSTGKPKGVMIEHKSLVSFFENSSYHFGFKESQTLASSTNFTFDISILEHLGVLVSGMKLLLLNNSSESLLTVLKNKKVDILQVTPSKLNQLLLLEEDSIKYLSRLNYLLIGGEPLGEKLFSLVKNDLKQVNVLNVYGPTETVIWSACSNLHQTEKLTIGTPLLNENIFICGPNNKLVPINVNGEICISGPGLSRGYLNRPGLTQEKFIIHPFKEDELLYKTGDIGKWLPDGTIECLGRKDDQVKIRGYRIELGEAENSLQKLEGIDSCVVLSKELESSQELVAYLQGNDLSISEIRNELGKILPSYMIPSHFVELEEFPLTPSGKVDKKALPNPEGLGMGTGVEYIAPRNETEEVLVEIWSTVLGVPKEQIGINDNFFDLGGDSLKATKVVSKIQFEWGIKLSIKELYGTPKVEAVSEIINLILWNSSELEEETEEISI